jgi:hypothetical protein
MRASGTSCRLLYPHPQRLTARNLQYIFGTLDADGDLWPEGLGNVERPGMGQEKLDVTIYTIRGLWDLADMARSKGDAATVAWAEERARSMERRFESAWWLGDTRYGYVPQYADSLRDPGHEKVFQRHWIGVTPMESEVVRQGRTVPGIASRAHGVAALQLRERDCYSGRFGLYHTGTGPTSDPAGNPGPTCDPWVSDRPSERSNFTLNTSIMAVGEGNYGRLGRTQQHQQLGVRPDLGNGRLEVTPQVPPYETSLSGANIRLGSGSVDVLAAHSGHQYTTTARLRVAVRLRLGATLPFGAHIGSVQLNGRPVAYQVRRTNQGLEVVANAGHLTTRTSTLTVTTL